MSFKDLDGFLNIDICDQIDFCLGAIIQDDFGREWKNRFIYVLSPESEFTEISDIKNIKVLSLSVYYVPNYLDFINLSSIKEAYLGFDDNSVIFYGSNLKENDIKKYVKENMENK